MQICDTGTCGRARADRTAISRKPADALLLVQREEVGEQQRPQQTLVAHTQLPGVNNDRQRDRHALVSTSGVDDDRHLAAVHSRVGASGGVCPRLFLRCGSAIAEQQGADRRAVLSAQADLRDGGVVRDLTLKQRRNIRKIATLHKVVDPAQAQVLRIVVRQLRLRILMIQNRPILFNENDVRVLLNDPRRGGIRPAGADDLDVEQKTALHRNDLKCRCVEVGRELFDRFPAHSGDDLQLRLLVASEDADGGGGREALAVSSVRNDHALHILDDVSADDNPHLVRKTTERRAGNRRAVGNGNRLGAAHRTNQFFFQQAAVCLIGNCIYHFSLRADAPPLSLPLHSLSGTSSGRLLYFCYIFIIIPCNSFCQII